MSVEIFSCQSCRYYYELSWIYEQKDFALDFCKVFLTLTTKPISLMNSSKVLHM